MGMARDGVSLAAAEGFVCVCEREYGREGAFVWKTAGVHEFKCVSDGSEHI